MKGDGEEKKPAEVPNLLSLASPSLAQLLRRRKLIGYCKWRKSTGQPMMLYPR
jgi:hypothetical protein